MTLPEVPSSWPLQSDVEAKGALLRLAEIRSDSHRDLVLLASNHGSLRAAANLVANLHFVGLQNYFLLADSAGSCTSVAGRLACVWSSLVEYMRRTLGRISGDARVRALWLGRQIYAGRLAELGFNVMLLDSDSIIFADPFALIRTQLNSYQLVIMADHSRTWMNSNCGTYYLQGARPGGPLLAAWRHFERRALGVLNGSWGGPTFPLATTSHKPELLLAWENT